MCVPSLNEIHESFKLSDTQDTTFYSGAMEVKPIYPRFLSGDIRKYIQSSWHFYALIYIINLFSYTLPGNENEKNDKTPKFFMVQNSLYLFHALLGAS